MSSRMIASCTLHNPALQSTRQHVTSFEITRHTRRHLLLTPPVIYTSLLLGTVATKNTTEAIPLAPLGKVEHVGGNKLVGLTLKEVADILTHNLRDGQYFITGDLTPEIFEDDARFRDPTNDVSGLARYLKALTLLFDASYSAVRLKDISINEANNTIHAQWTLGGYLKFPWQPRVEPFVGETIYYLNDRGLIYFQDQTWSISAGEALKETFTPTFGQKKRDIIESEG